MTHQCELKDDMGCCIEVNGKLIIQEYVTQLGMMEGRKYEVNFCPECGYTLSKDDFSSRLRSPYIPFIPDADESIHRFSSELSRAISEMNHNVLAIKTFMSAQNTQNECFMDRDLQTSQKLSELERRIKELEK